MKLSIASAAFVLAYALPGAAALPATSGDEVMRQVAALKAQMEKGTTPALQERYRALLDRLPRPVAPSAGRAPLAVANALCVAGSLDVTDPTYDRMPGGSTPGSCGPSPLGSGVYYDAYEFTLTGCTDLTQQITIFTCGTAPCSSTGTLLDTLIHVNQKPGGAPGTPGSPATYIFDPTAPCTNFVAANDDFCGGLSQISTNALVGGNFVVVVTTFTATATGSYHLAIDTGTTGCTVAQTASTPAELTTFAAR